jgi:HEAT repeat protein
VLVRQQDAQTLSQLAASEASPTAAERLDAAAVMAAAGDGKSAELLWQAAQAAPGGERAELCLVLAEAGDARCAPLLAALAHGASPELRWQVAVALALLGRSPARMSQVTAPLLPLLADPEPRVATAAAVAVLGLGATGASASASTIVGALSRWLPGAPARRRPDPAGRGRA